MTHTTPIHPGEHLAEMLAELGVSQYRLARTIGVPPRRINEIVHGRRSITADTALPIGRALGTTPEFWLNLQQMYDLDLARTSADVSRIEPLVATGQEVHLVERRWSGQPSKRPSSPIDAGPSVAPPSRWTGARRSAGDVLRLR